MRTTILCVAGGLGLFANIGAAQPTEGLAPYFGFDEPRFIKVDEDCGPAAVGDFNGDGRPDVAVVNNRKSRIELYYLRATPRSADEVQKSLKANELPQNPWYDREYLSVAHRVTALVSVDVDADKKAGPGVRRRAARRACRDAASEGWQVRGGAQAAGEGSGGQGGQLSSSRM
jgi:hypothetical protein